MRVSTEPNRKKSFDIRPKVYILAFEGIKTEQRYFEGVRKFADILGIDTRSKILLPLTRSFGLEEGHSNPEKALEIFLDYIFELREKKWCLETLASHIVDWAVTQGLVKRKANSQYLDKIRVSLLEMLRMTENENIDVSNIENIATKSYHILLEILQMQHLVKQYERYLNYLKNQAGIGLIGEVIPCFVIDRDKRSFTNQAFVNVCKLCQENSIHLYISNPQFEFWLLLHFCNPKQNITQIMENPDTLYSLLKKFVRGNPKYVQFQRDYLRNVDLAIQNETDYSEENLALNTNPGSNIGVLIKELRKS